MKIFIKTIVRYQIGLLVRTGKTAFFLGPVRIRCIIDMGKSQTGYFQHVAMDFASSIRYVGSSKKNLESKYIIIL